MTQFDIQVSLLNISGPRRVPIANLTGIATYQKLIDMGGEQAEHGYQFQVDTWRDAKQYDKAIEVARKAVEANPKNRELKLMLAAEMGDLSKTDEGLARATSTASRSAARPTAWRHSSIRSIS